METVTSAHVMSVPDSPTAAEDSPLLFSDSDPTSGEGEGGGREEGGGG